MTVVIESSKTHFGEAYIVTATLDKYHRSVVREFFTYSEAQALAYEFLKNPMEPEYLAMFKRKGL